MARLLRGAFQQHSGGLHAPRAVPAGKGKGRDDRGADVHADEAYDADEAFLTSASNFVLPIVEIDSKRIGGGQPGPVTRKLREIFLEEAMK